MKKALVFLLILALFCSCAVPALAENSVIRTNQNLTVDGKAVICEIYNINDSNYFKLRDLAFLLNGTGSQFSVGYDESSRTVSIVTGGAYVPNGSELVIGEDKASTAQPSSQALLINAQRRTDLSVFNIGGNNYFKLRDLGTALGFDVDYNDATRTMIVNSRSAQQKRELTAEEIYAKCVPAVFYIEVYDAYGDALCSGSGFFIDSIGTAVTNYHVIYGGHSAKIMVTNTDGSYRTYDVLGVSDYSEEEDWAVLKIDGSGFQWLEFGSPSTAVGGATVYALGSPLGLDSTISQGLISNPARMVDGQVYIQTSAAISAGSSGGALLNKYGEVIGITSAGFEEGQNLNLAIPIGRLSGIRTGEYVPISSTCIMPSGLLTADQYYIRMEPNDSVTDIITAVESNCDEATSVMFEIEDPSMLSCSWGTWTGDTIPLYIESGDVYGSTVVWLYYYTRDTGTVLAGDYIIVDVLAGHLAPSDAEDFDLTLEKGSSYTVDLVGYSYDGRSVYVHVYPDDEGIVSFAFGEWDGIHIPLTISADGSGCTYVNLQLLDAETDEELTSDYIFVEVP